MAKCAKCSQAILEPYVFRVGDLVLHQQCLQCAECASSLSEACFVGGGSLLCRRDYYRRFGPRCRACECVIEFDGLSVRIGGWLFHADCLACAVCRAHIKPKSKIRCSPDGAVFCEDHAFMAMDCFDRDSGLGSECDQTPVGELTAKAEKARALEDEDEEEEENGGSKSPKSSGDADSDSERKEGKENKRRGPRTTIKAKQLEVLKEVFSQTPKPTRLMREQLAKETGLPMRVIQVWFQNKRSKEKRLHQMRFMARAPFMPPPQMHAHPHLRGRFCGFPPNGMPFEYFDCGPPPFGSPYHMSGPGGGGFGDPGMGMGFLPGPPGPASCSPSDDQSSLLQSFPSPPHQPDFHSTPPPPSTPSSAPGSSSTPTSSSSDVLKMCGAEACFPSPPLSLEYASTPTTSQGLSS